MDESTTGLIVISVSAGNVLTVLGATMKFLTKMSEVGTKVDILMHRYYKETGDDIQK